MLGSGNALYKDYNREHWVLQLHISWLYKYFKIEPRIHDLRGNGLEVGLLFRGIIGITLKIKQRKVNFLVASLISQLI